MGNKLLTILAALALNACMVGEPNFTQEGATLEVVSQVCAREAACAGVNTIKRTADCVEVQMETLCNQWDGQCGAELTNTQMHQMYSCMEVLTGGFKCPDNTVIPDTCYDALNWHKVD